LLSLFVVVALTGTALAQDPMPPGTDATAAAKPADSTADAVKPIKVAKADKHKAKHKAKHRARKHKKSHRHAAQ
jgi:hypothetical protein